MNSKIIAHIKGIQEDSSWLQEGFFILVRVSNRGLMWITVENYMLNRWDDVQYTSVERAKRELVDYFGAENVVFEPYTGIEVY